MYVYFVLSVKSSCCFFSCVNLTCIPRTLPPQTPGMAWSKEGCEIHIQIACPFVFLPLAHGGNSQMHLWSHRYIIIPSPRYTSKHLIGP